MHERFSEKELVKLTVKHPLAKIIAHPECPENLLSYAHHIGSTSSLLNYVKQNVGFEFIVLNQYGFEQPRGGEPLFGRDATNIVKRKVRFL